MSLTLCADQPTGKLCAGVMREVPTSGNSCHPESEIDDDVDAESGGSPEADGAAPAVLMDMPRLVQCRIASLMPCMRLRILGCTCTSLLELTREHLVVRGVARDAHKWHHRCQHES
eukprot:jgi/Astpho2/104/Aster-04574